MALQEGERKPVMTDRVILVPRSDADIALVCRIYAMYLVGGLAGSAIAAQLRVDGRINHLGKPWDAATVRGVLTLPAVYANSHERMGDKPVPVGMIKSYAS